MSGVRAGFPETASEREGEKDGEMKEEKWSKERKKGLKNKIDHQADIERVGKNKTEGEKES